MLRRTSFGAFLLAAATFAPQNVLAQDPNSGNNGSQPFKLGAETNQVLTQPAYPDYPAYPAPHMVPAQPHMAPPPKKKQPIKGNVTQTQVRPMQAGIQGGQPPAPIQASAQQGPPPGVLPQQFLGNWTVLGSRAEIQARPEYQSGIENIFSATNSQRWNFNGGPGGYTMGSDTGIQSVQVGNCTPTIAFIRYQHQMKNTMIQEAVVLQLSPDGRSFQGKERISVVKPGEPTPRAQVTYNLMGRR